MVTHEPDRRRFVTRVSGGLAMLEYLPVGQGLVDFYHTYVPDGNRGRGVAAALVEAGVAWAGAQGARVIPSCWYVRAWFGRHPERAHLRAPAE
jgi:predicted GNAT family acetyltransferase